MLQASLLWCTAPFGNSRWTHICSELYAAPNVNLLFQAKLKPHNQQPYLSVLLLVAARENLISELRDTAWQLAQHIAEGADSGGPTTEEQQAYMQAQQQAMLQSQQAIQQQEQAWLPQPSPPPPWSPQQPLQPPASMQPQSWQGPQQVYPVDQGLQQQHQQQQHKGYPSSSWQQQGPSVLPPAWGNEGGWQHVQGQMPPYMQRSSPPQQQQQLQQGVHLNGYHNRCNSQPTSPLQQRINDAPPACSSHGEGAVRLGSPRAASPSWNSSPNLKSHKQQQNQGDASPGRLPRSCSASPRSRTSPMKQPAWQPAGVGAGKQKIRQLQQQQQQQGSAAAYQSGPGSTRSAKLRLRERSSSTSGSPKRMAQVWMSLAKLFPLYCALFLDPDHNDLTRHKEALQPSTLFS